MAEIVRFERRSKSFSGWHPSRARVGDAARRVLYGRRRWEQLARRIARRISRYVRFRVYGFFVLAALFSVVFLIQHGSLPTSMRYGRDQALGRFTAAAIDGDSLRANGKDIRLHGIDAPELRQTCLDEHGIPWACGQQAHALLRSLASRGSLVCSARGTDRYGRTLATCSAGDVEDLGDAMVRAGLAVSFMSSRYWLAELGARWHERGMWRGSFERPHDWRRHLRRSG